MNQSVRSFATGVLITTLGAAPLLSLVGCEGSMRSGEGHETSKALPTYKERTAVQFLTKKQLDDYADSANVGKDRFPGSAADRDAFKDRLNHEFNVRDPSARSPIFIAAALFLTGELIKLAVDYLKQEAKQHVASFDARGSSSQYYADGSSKFVGIELRRDVYEVIKDGDTTKETWKVNAETLILLMRPAASKDPNGLFSLRPVYFQENGPRAKKVDGDRRMTSAVTVTLEGAWRVGDDAMNARLTEYAFAVEKYKVGTIEKGELTRTDGKLDAGQAITSLADMDVESKRPCGDCCGQTPSRQSSQS